MTLLCGPCFRRHCDVAHLLYFGLLLHRSELARCCRRRHVSIGYVEQHGEFLLFNRCFKPCLVPQHFFPANKMFRNVCWNSISTPSIWPVILVNVLVLFLLLLLLELCCAWPAVTPPTLLELCHAWPAVTPPTLHVL